MEQDRSWQQVGRCLAALARSVPPPDLPIHDADAEAAVTRRWVDRAIAAGRLPRASLDEALQSLTNAPATPLGIAHRDLHDGQLLFTHGRPGMLDPDTLAAAEPALDLANLLVHLDLRVEQGYLSADDRDRTRDRILIGAAPAQSTLQRLPEYEIACRLRLAAVYAFRPRWHTTARRWFHETLRTSSHDPLEVVR
ncbi:MAG: aminoglycoside phosphotransferase family protein [Intrasporangiaceae bacterium]|nr:aminoglycoside phosphotransferase family protein [Intrasporangiaceae bacterium]